MRVKRNPHTKGCCIKHGGKRDGGRRKGGGGERDKGGYKVQTRAYYIYKKKMYTAAEPPGRN